MTGPNWSEVGEEGTIGVGGFGLLSLDVCVSIEGGHCCRMEHGRMSVHMHLMEIFQVFPCT